MSYFQAIYIDDVAQARRQLDHGIDVDALFLGDTALILAARMGGAAMCTLLLARGADVHARDERHGGSALFNVLCGYDVDANLTPADPVDDFLATAHVLLDAGADPREEVAMIATYPPSRVRALLLEHAERLDARALRDHLSRRWVAGGHALARARL